MSAPIETWKEMWCGAEFQCFRDERGETFHFRKARLMRGKPSGPYNTIEEYTRPAHERGGATASASAPAFSSISVI